MFKPNRPQRYALLIAALVIGVGTASLVLSDGFEGVTWIAGVLVTAALAFIGLSGPDRAQAVHTAPVANAAPANGDGSSLERALPIKAANSAEGIRIEYETLSKLFGKPKADWNILGRKVLQHSGRSIEHFVLSTKAGRKEMFFDISMFVGQNKSVADAIPVSLHDPILNRSVTITFLPRAAFDLQNFLTEIDGNSKAAELLDARDMANLKAAFEKRRKREGQDEIIIDLPQMTAIKLGVLLEMVRKQTEVLEVQDWLDNCAGAIRYALQAK
jgi:hypothetical protein